MGGTQGKRRMRKGLCKLDWGVEKRRGEKVDNLIKVRLPPGQGFLLGRSLYKAQVPLLCEYSPVFLIESVLLPLFFLSSLGIKKLHRQLSCLLGEMPVRLLRLARSRDLHFCGGIFLISLLLRSLNPDTVPARERCPRTSAVEDSWPHSLLECTPGTGLMGG